MISPEAADCPVVFPPEEIRQGVRGDGPQLWVSLVSDCWQTILPE